jgi:exodeoxyribonuclease V gamma subunit
MAERKEPEPFLGKGLSEPEESWKKPELQGLCAFFSNPAKFLLNRRLGIYLEERSSLAEEREPFEVHTLERYLLEESMLRRRLQGRSLNEDFVFAVASGRLPHGPVGQCTYEQFSPGVKRFAEDLLPLLDKEPIEPLDFRVDVGDFSLTGSLDRVSKERMVRYRYATLKGKDLMAGWIHHLALNCVRQEGYGRRTLLGGLSEKSGKGRKSLFYEFAPLEGGEEVLKALFRRYWEGLREPLAFFPQTSWHYAKARLAEDKTREAALREARVTWEGNQWNKRGEMEDPHYQLCFGKADPLDSRFEDIALEIFELLLKHLKEA